MSSNLKNPKIGALSKVTQEGLNKNIPPEEKLKKNTKVLHAEKKIEDKIIDLNLEINNDQSKNQRLEQFLLVSHYIDNNIIRSHGKAKRDKDDADPNEVVEKKDKLNLLIKDLNKKVITRNEVFLLNGVEFPYRAERKPLKKKKKVVLSLVEKLKVMKKINSEDIYERNDIDNVIKKYMVEKETPTPTPHSHDETHNGETPEQDKKDCLIY